jgi:hypothetical protein
VSTRLICLYVYDANGGACWEIPWLVSVFRHRFYKLLAYR